MAKRRATSKAPTRTGASLEDYNLFEGDLQDLEIRFLKCEIEEYLNLYGSIEFIGEEIKSKEQAIDNLKNGKPELLKEFKELESLELKQQKNDVLKGYELATEGQFFSVDDYLNGSPEHWYSEILEEGNQSKDFFINIAAPWFYTKNDFYRKLIKVVQYIDFLEGNGTRLNIYLVMNMKSFDSNKMPHSFKFRLKIKEDSEPINLQQLIYLVSTPVVLRLYYAVMAFDLVGKNWGEVSQDQAIESIFMDIDNIVYIPSMFYDYLKKDKLKFNQNTDLLDTYPHLKEIN